MSSRNRRTCTCGGWVTPAAEATAARCGAQPHLGPAICAGGRRKGFPGGSLAGAHERGVSIPFLSGAGVTGVSGLVATASCTPRTDFLAEWPQRSEAAATSWLSNLPAETSLESLAQLAGQSRNDEGHCLEMKRPWEHLEGRTSRRFSPCDAFSSHARAPGRPQATTCSLRPRRKSQPQPAPWAMKDQPRTSTAKDGAFGGYPLSSLRWRLAGLVLRRFRAASV